MRAFTDVSSKEARKSLWSKLWFEKLRSTDASDGAKPKIVRHTLAKIGTCKAIPSQNWIGAGTGRVVIAKGPLRVTH